jgi:hypothetical protein
MDPVNRNPEIAKNPQIPIVPIAIFPFFEKT